MGAVLLLALPLAARGEGWGLTVAGAFHLRVEEALAVGALAAALARSLVATAGQLLDAAPARYGVAPLGAAGRRRWRVARPWLRLGLVLPMVLRALSVAAPVERPRLWEEHARRPRAVGTPRKGGAPQEWTPEPEEGDCACKEPKRRPPPRPPCRAPRSVSGD